MRRHRRNNPINKTIGIIFPLLLITLGTVGYSYSLWSKTLTIQGNITTGTWEKVASVRIMKTLNGSFTNPVTGEDLLEPNTTHIAVAADFPTKFQLIITVENNGTVSITDAVYDVIENTVKPINWTPSKGTVTWVNKTTAEGFEQNFLTWTIGTLVPSERATLEIWIETLRNPAGKYEPTSGDEGDWQYIEINRGANITATYDSRTLFAETEEITLTIVDDGIQGNGIGLISAPPLPYSTPWAWDSETIP